MSSRNGTSTPLAVFAAETKTRREALRRIESSGTMGRPFAVLLSAHEGHVEWGKLAAALPVRDELEGLYGEDSVELFLDGFWLGALLQASFRG